MTDPVTYQTGAADIFVGGDVYTGPKFAIDAIAAGKEGAVSIHRFVQPNTSLTIGRDPRRFISWIRKTWTSAITIPPAARSLPSPRAGNAFPSGTPTAP